MRPIDALLDAAQHRVETSGILDTTARMGVVSAVGTDGTITVAVADSTIPRVRLLRSAQPSVGATVEVLRTAGGWVCIGELATVSPAWVTPTIAAPFAPYGGAYRNPRFRRVGSSVEIEGTVSKSNSTTGNFNLFTLPVGYRPAGHVIFAVPTTNSVARQLTVNSTGVVQIRDLTATTDYVGITVRFSVD